MIDDDVGRYHQIDFPIWVKVTPSMVKLNGLSYHYPRFKNVIYLKHSAFYLKVTESYKVNPIGK